MVKCLAFRFQNVNSSTAAAAGTVSVRYCASKAALLRGQLYSWVLLRHPMSMLWSRAGPRTDRPQFLLFRTVINS